MTEYVFPFYNLTLPENEYTNDDYGTRIELLDVAEEFDENHRNRDSEYQTGYWHTANVYIEQDIEKAKEIADILSQILSFALHRDVRFSGYFAGTGKDAHHHTITTLEIGIDNTNIPIIRGVPTGPPNPGLELGPFIDLGLETLLEAEETERTRILVTLNQFLEASSSNVASVKFIVLWIALESSANQNYESYQQKVGDQFSEEERNRVLSLLLENAEDEFSEDQIKFLEYRFSQKYLYEHSIDVKIKIYLEYLGIGFDIDEIEDIIQESREIRNLVAHEADAGRLLDNLSHMTDLRKIVIYVVLRRLGVDEDFQNRLITPQIIGPEIS